MAKPPRMTAPKIKPVAKPAPKPVAKPAPKPVAKPMSPSAVLGRAERIQKMEAGESRLAKYQPPKNKPATPMVPPADRARTQATLSRAERIQGEEARGDALLMQRKPVDVIRTTVRMKETPAKKK